MIARIKAIIAVFLAWIYGLFGISPVTPSIEPAVNPSDPIPYEDMTDEEYYSEIFKPVLRFSVCSDTHVKGEYDTAQKEKVQLYFDRAYSYAESQEYKGLDAILFAGDCSNDGSTSALNAFFGVVGENSREGTVIRACMGNHEFYSSPRSLSDERFLQASGYSEVNKDIVIGGCHFIFISPNEDSPNGEHYYDEELDWLAARLKADAAEDSTGRKPIFIISHIAPVGTVYTTDEEEAMHDFDEIFAKYPQIVNITGHTHSPANDPKSIWQGDYTVLNCGSMEYYGGGLAGICEKYVYPTDHNGGCNIGIPGNHSLSDAGDYYIIEVDKNAAIKITGFYLYSEDVAFEWYVRSVGDPSSFRYTENRTDRTYVPVFAEGDSLTVSNLGGGSVNIAVPQTKNEAYTQHYRLELYGEGGSLKDTVYVLSDRFYTPVPETVCGSFDGLASGTEYTVKCFAVSAFALESEPLCLSFTLS